MHTDYRTNLLLQALINYIHVSPPPLLLQDQSVKWDDP